MPSSVSSVSKLATYSGKYKIHECAIIIPPANEAGVAETIDIKNILTTLTIYEDLFSNYLTGDVVIEDPHNLLAKMPIIGQEYLKLTYTDEYPETSPKIDIFFNIVGINGRTLVGERNQVYQLRLASLEAIKNNNTTISKSFKGNTSDVAFKIFKDYLDSGKNMSTDASRNEVKFVAADWTPFQTINWLAQRSVDRFENKGGFLFFETRFGFNFSSIHQMVQQPSMGHYVFTPANLAATKKGTRRIINYSVLSSFDTLEKMQDGSLGSTVHSVDYTSKTYKTHKTDYKTYYLRSPHLENTHDKYGKPTWMYPAPINPENREVTLSQSSWIYDNVESNFVDQWYSSYLMSIRQFETQRMSIEIEPDFDLSVGDVIDVTIPDAIATTASRDEDKLLSGKYLITAIRRTFRLDHEIMVLEISKDSFKEGLHR